MIARLLRTPVAWLVAAVLLLGAAWWLYGAITAKPKAEARLGHNTTEAALESGRDAVGAVSAEAAAERASDDLTRENADAIRHAEGADARVAAPARDAGLRSLCKRAAYRGSQQCLQLAPAP